VSDYLTKKAVQLFFETATVFNLMDKDISSFRREGNVTVLHTSNKLYVRSIKR